MGAALKIVDETPGGRVLQRTTLVLVSERVTAREIIERRVRQEVAEFNARQEPGVFQGLVQPREAELALHGYRLRRPRALDADEQCALALEAFDRRGFLMLADRRQIASLDQAISVARDSVISFVKLVPLVGG